MTILLIVLLVLLLCGAGWGWRGGYMPYGNPLWLVVVIILVLLLLGLFLPFAGYHWYP